MDTYSTDYLAGVIEALDRPATPMLDLFFRTTMEFDTETINFDRLPMARRLAPFVSPQIAGKALRQRGQSTVTFTPAYVKPKHAVTPSNALKRAASPIPKMSPPTSSSKASMPMSAGRRAWQGSRWIIVSPAVIMQKPEELPQGRAFPRERCRRKIGPFLAQTR